MSLHMPPAVVRNLRKRIAALDIEFELLSQEEAIAQGGKEHLERIALIKTRKIAATDDLSVQEARWQDELTLVQQILALRSANAGNTADQAAKSTVAAELMRMESDLHIRQQDAPLIHFQVDEAVVAAIVADWTGIPVGRMVRDEVRAVLELQATLNRRVMGQTGALHSIAERVQTACARLSDENKPVGVFLLVGPSGVGKTETALALAEAMYGGEQNLITINMSEFQESHTVSTLKGAPPGYVGYGEGGILTEAVRRKPYSVILLDEVEKAHPDVHEIFYQVFDKGWMEDGEGRHIDFRNTIILLTSNTGADLITHFYDDPVSGSDATTLCEALQPELRRVFPAAFIGRLCVVPYLPLDEHMLADIVSLQLTRVVERMQMQHDIELNFTPALVRHVVAQCGVHETGARRSIGFIEQHLLPVLSRHWLDALQDKRNITRIAVDIGAQDANFEQRSGSDIV